MKKILKKIIYGLTPPILWSFYRRYKGSNLYGFFGNYSSWTEARNDADGYDSFCILNTVKESLLKVKEGQAVYERDSVLFDKIQYSFALLAALLRIAVENQGTLSVLDFGGSLGSSYFQSREFLSSLNYLSWNIVEQENFVNCGKKYFENQSLKFFYTIESCIEHTNPNVILLSSVVQYLENPYSFLTKLLDYNFEYIIFDRTAFVLEGSDLLTVQKVPPEIYLASYPAWFLKQDKFLDIFLDNYELIFEFNSFDRVNIPSRFKGFFLKLKTL
jgi:putative methyltransferase (TIGR04325 family)